MLWIYGIIKLFLQTEKVYTMLLAGIKVAEELWTSAEKFPRKTEKSNAELAIYVCKFAHAQTKKLKKFLNHSYIHGNLY